MQTEPRPERPPQRPEPNTKLSARERMLAALEAAPRLSTEDAERINRIVREAREASIADGLPH